MQQGDGKAYQELKNRLEQIENGRTSAQKHNMDFVYLPEGYNDFHFGADQQALGIANWWHPENEGTGIGASISTNYSGNIFVVDLDAFNHTTNALLYIHISGGEP